MWTFKKNSGLYFFVFCILFSLTSLLLKDHSGHYDFFSASAIKIWHGENPYGIGYPSGLFNYSPSCAFFFYGLFAFFPYKLGLGIYMGGSCLLLLWGLHRLLSILAPSALARNMFYVLGASELIGTVLNARIEIFTLAIHVIAAGSIIKRERLGLAYFLLAMVTNWKMQSLPIIGLFLLFEVVRFKNYRAIATTAASIAFWYAIPFAIKPVDFIKDCYRVWKQFLDDMIRAGWMDFQHIYRFIWKTTGFEISWTMGQIGSAAFGLLLALMLFAMILKKKTNNELVLWIIGIGGIYASVFSPASQSAAYVLYIPAVLLVATTSSDASTRPLARYGFLLLCWFLISACYSDLVPRALHSWCFDHAVKAAGALLLALGILAMNIRELLAPSRPAT